jgi:hypothetical protein
VHRMRSQRGQRGVRRHAMRGSPLRRKSGENHRPGCWWRRRHARWGSTGKARDSSPTGKVSLPSEWGLNPGDHRCPTRHPITVFGTRCAPSKTCMPLRRRA